MNAHLKTDVNQVVTSFYKNVTPEQRYASYDFCFGYFQTHRHELTNNMESSCLQLWSYLASWGMLRGSSKLLSECSMKALEGVIRYIDKLPDEDWALDVKDYSNDSKCNRIIEIANEIVSRIEHIQVGDNEIGVSATPTLVTKIMLGTLGCVPAMDDLFSSSFRNEFADSEKKCSFRKLSITALKCILEFYSINKDFDDIQISVMDFEGEPVSGLFYRKAKLVDMYGWSKGLENRLKVGSRK